MHLKNIENQKFPWNRKLKVKFHENINVIIAPNGVCKTAVIDAIRLFFQLGDIDSENRLTESAKYGYNNGVSIVQPLRKEPN